MSKRTTVFDPPQTWYTLTPHKDGIQEVPGVISGNAREVIQVVGGCHVHHIGGSCFPTPQAAIEALIKHNRRRHQAAFAAYNKAHRELEESMEALKRAEAMRGADAPLDQEEDAGD